MSPTAVLRNHGVRNQAVKAQCLVKLRKQDERGTLFRHRILAVTTLIDTLSDAVTSAVMDRSQFLIDMLHTWVEAWRNGKPCRMEEYGLSLP